jgi:hypothetical protein
MELYDENHPGVLWFSKVCQCVVLSCRYSSRRYITFRRVVRKVFPSSRWCGRIQRVPNTRRIPSHVCSDRCRSRPERSQKLPPVPSTPVPLISPEAKIGHVERIRHEARGRVCTPTGSNLYRMTRLIIIKPCTHVLYVTHFPMSPCNSALSPGARVQATNIHMLCRSLDPGVGTILGAHKFALVYPC